MKLCSFKRYRPAGIVICMLAAGICYSCNGCGPLEPPDESVVELKVEESSALEIGGEAGKKPESLEVPGTEASRETGGEQGEKAGVRNDREADGKGSGTVFVHVCGQVAKPGVYELPVGSRVYEAVEAAGGFAGEAAGDYLNLAEKVQDGMRLEVPDREEAQQWQSQGHSGIALSGGQEVSQGEVVKVNINTASLEELMGLKGIGQSRAEDIIRYRDRFGGFGAIEDIMNVSGIKEAAFEKIKDSITV